MDFTDVESFIKCAEGEHIAILKEVEEKVSSSGSDMLSVKFEVTKGSSTGATVYDNFVLTEKALWKLKSYLEVVGMKATGKIQIDLDKLIGKACIIQVKYEEYDGKQRSTIDGYKKFAADSAAEDDDEDYEEEEETPTPPPAKKKPKKKPAPVEDDDDEEYEDDEEEETPKEKKARLAAEKAAAEAKAKKKPKKKPAPVEDDDDEEWDEA